jgi:PTS system fructose-specific IIA component/PTS system nitrogen regulatory IIA component
MKFADFINNKAINANVEATDKEAVIRELVGGLVSSGGLKAADKDAIIEAILKREELGTTGIGRGIAVPHTKHASVKSPVGTVGVSAEGVDFKSLDGEPVQLFFMLISPPDQQSEHLKALENITKKLHDETFCRFLKQSKTADDVQQILTEADDNQFVS